MKFAISAALFNYARESDAGGIVVLHRAFVVAAIALIATSAPAQADKQQFLDFIHSQGVPPSYFGTAGADYSNVKAAEMICDVLHNGGGPQDIPFLGFQQNGYRDVLIDGARRFMCPDTLH